MFQLQHKCGGQNSCDHQKLSLISASLSNLEKVIYKSAFLAATSFPAMGTDLTLRRHLLFQNVFMKPWLRTVLHQRKFYLELLKNLLTFVIRE